MNSPVAKQFMLLAGKPLLMHTIIRFYEADASAERIVVLPAKEIKHWENLCTQYSFTIPHRITEGCETRFHSVQNGLKLVNEPSVVAVHDGARPFAGADLINKCFTEAEQKGNAVPVIQVNESLRKLNHDSNEPVVRSSFVVVQTPQCFESGMLKKAYAADYRENFTDDASVVESTGNSIHLVEGNKENIKITFPSDFAAGEAILRNFLKKE